MIIQLWQDILVSQTLLTCLILMEIRFAGIAIILSGREGAIIALRDAWMNLTGTIPGILSEKMS